MRIKPFLPAVAMMVGLFFLPGLCAACPKCFGASAKQVLNAYYASIAFMALIPFGIIGAILVWIQRQVRRQRL